MKTNELWLTSSIDLPYWTEKPTQKPGRPPKTLKKLCDRSKRRKTKGLREQAPVEELTYAVRISGNTRQTKLIMEITGSPTRAKKSQSYYYFQTANNCEETYT